MSEDTFDVLAAHHHKNTKPRVPDANHLRQSATQHTRHPDPSDTESDESSDTQTSNGKCGSPRPHKRAKRHSKTPYSRMNKGKGKPTQLQFYPSHWVDVLEKAKKKKRLHIIKERPFAECERHLSDATDCLTEALTEYQAAGGRVEPGKCPFYLLFWHRF